MFSLVSAALGTLVALGGVLMIAPQVRSGFVNAGGIGAWVMRAGLMILMVGEAVAVFQRPESRLVFKLMLMAGGAIVFVGLTILPYEWRQNGFVLQQSLSWQIILGGAGAYLAAVMFIQAIVMLVGVVTAWLLARASRRWLQAAVRESGQVMAAASRAQAVLLILTLILLFL